MLNREMNIVKEMSSLHKKCVGKSGYGQPYGAAC